MKKGQKRAEIKKCTYCDYICSKIYDWNRHLTTHKHKMLINANEKGQNEIPAVSLFYCECARKYKHLSSLCKHKKICPLSLKSHENLMNNNENQLSIITELLQQNKDLQQQIIEMSKEVKIITNTTTNNNKNFNLNFFLNETCKDAMNLMDFVNSLQIKLSDFETTGRIGYVEGISKIIVNGLRQMDVNKRPIHCTDIKRETMYIRNEDTWEKENDDRTKLANAVKMVANKNFQQMREWQEKYPDCVLNNTPKNDEFVNIMLAVLGGQSEEEEDKNRDKILRNIAKEVIIDKNCPD